MKEPIIAVTAIICLTILGIFIVVYIPEASKALFAIVAIIGGIAGFYIPRATVRAIARIRKK